MFQSTFNSVNLFEKNNEANNAYVQHKRINPPGTADNLTDLRGKRASGPFKTGVKRHP